MQGCADFAACKFVFLIYIQTGFGRAENRFWPVLRSNTAAGGRSRKRKVRTPKGAMPRNPSLFDWDTRGRKVERVSDGQCHRKQTAFVPLCGTAVMVKR